MVVSGVYLDHAATTPLAPEVWAEMSGAVELFGNPSSLHGTGRRAREVVDRARSQVAGLIGADPSEIVFTGGGTEADNLALIGAARANLDRGRHVVTTAIEHHAILHTVEWMADNGWEVTIVGVSPDGLVDPHAIERAMRPDTVLVSVMYANNEVGTIQPIRDIAALVQARGALFHTDAVQAAGQVPIDVSDLSVDLLTLSGHKIYGPKGIGALYVKKGVGVEPVIHGGGHEWGLRAGTENSLGIVGLGAAAELARRQLVSRSGHLLRLRERLREGLFAQIPDLRLNGHPDRRLPNNLNVSVTGVEGEALLLNLDLQGISVSSGSACTSGSIEPSHVLKAMGTARMLGQSSVRMTVGAGTTDDDVDRVLSVMPDIVERLRSMSPLGKGKGN